MAPMKPRSSLSLLWLMAGTSGVLAAEPPPARTVLVVCAPGYPGNTQEAQPTMDLFATTLAGMAELSATGVAAVYYEREADGLARLTQADASWAMVPLPFYLAHAEALRLSAELVAVPQDGNSNEDWTLVAKKGRVTGPATLGGWELFSSAAYVPAFLQRVVLADWGTLPPSVKFTTSGGVLSQLKRAATGENVALILDRTQFAALARLPFASDLESVTKSGPLPGGLFCSVGRRNTPAQRDAILAALGRMEQSAEGKTLLTALRLARFAPIETESLARAKRRFGGGSAK